MEYSIVTAISEEPFFSDIGYFIINSGVTSESVISELYGFSEERTGKIFSALQMAKVLSDPKEGSERQILMSASEFDSLLASCKENADPLDSLQLDLHDSDGFMHKENHWRNVYGADDEAIISVVFDTILHDGEIRVKRSESSERRSLKFTGSPGSGWRKKFGIKYICYDVSLPSAETDYTWLLIPHDDITEFTLEEMERLQALLRSWNIPQSKASLVFSDQDPFVEFIKKLGDYYPDLPFSVILVDKEKRSIAQEIRTDEIHKTPANGLFAKIMRFLKLTE